MPWQLVPLHAATEMVAALPAYTASSVGRRPSNEIVCRDLAVSGQHCIFHCRSAAEGDPPEVEDCSTNGTYVNEVKLSKGQRRRLVLGDVISLTKAPEDEGAAGAAVAVMRIQFRLDFVAEARPPAEDLAAGGPLSTNEVPPTAPDRRTGAEASGIEPAPALSAVPRSLAALPEYSRGGSERSFAQDLLVQEQQSKAKITGELLLAQRRLEEERQAVASASRELKRIRQQVDEERIRRQEAEENRDRLKSEVEALRADRKQLQELQNVHEDLEERHGKADAELQARLRKCVHLESAQEQARMEVERASEAQRKASHQQAELQARIRQAQERADRLEQQHGETKKAVAAALEEKLRLEGELAATREGRSSLEQQLKDLAARVAEAETGERAAREALDTAIARRAELECQVSGAQADADAARYSERQAQQRLSGSQRLAEKLQAAGRSLSMELRRRAEIWDRALATGNAAVLNDLMSAAIDVPTVAQATCGREDGDVPARASRSPCRDPFQVDGGLVPETPPDAQLAPPSLDAVHERQQADGQATVLGEASPLGAAPAAREDLLLEAVSALGAPSSAARLSSADRSDVDRSEEQRLTPGGMPDLCQLLGGTSTSGAPKDSISDPSRLPGGCSAAWSLEVLDLVEPVLPSTKRPRMS